MKSKKIVALIVAFAAFMAVATSGLAATTTYNYQSDGYVNVNVEAYAEKGSEVTYIVEHATSGIVYIDQQTADAGSGKVVFNYKIAADKIGDLKTTARYGTDGDEAVTSGGQLEFADANVSGENYNVSYAKKDGTPISGTAVLGTGDKVDATITPADNYQITGITFNDVALDNVNPATNTIEITKADKVVVATEKIETTPTVDIFTPATSIVEDSTYDIDGDGEEDAVVAKTTVLKVVGSPTKVGIKYDGQVYLAYADKNTLFTSNDGYCAVRLILPDGTVVADDAITEYIEYAK